MVREPFQVNTTFSLNKSSRKNSHSFILEWKTSPLISAKKKKILFQLSQIELPLPTLTALLIHFPKQMSEDSM